MLSEQCYKKIDRELAKYPADQRQSAVMAALAHAQVELGWLSPETMQEVADYIGMPAIAVQEVATFYNMYNLKPAGKHKITVCTNLPCALSGGERAAQRIKDALGIDSAAPPKTASSPWSKASAWAPAATHRSCW
jgi:NADH-quinone oxidoreductase subunit E